MRAQDGDGEWHDVQLDPEDRDRFKGFKWRVSWSGHVYRRTSIRVPDYPMPKGVKVWLHREILGLPDAKTDPRVVNHLDRDPLNNRKKNLEITTHEKNTQHWMNQDRENGAGRWAT